LYIFASSYHRIGGKGTLFKSSNRQIFSEEAVFYYQAIVELRKPFRFEAASDNNNSDVKANKIGGIYVNVTI